MRPITTKSTSSAADWQLDAAMAADITLDALFRRAFRVFADRTCRGRAISEGQVICSSGQPDIVDDERAILLWNDLADLVFDLLEYGFRALEPGTRRRADMELDLASVD